MEQQNLVISECLEFFRQNAWSREDAVGLSLRIGRSVQTVERALKALVDDGLILAHDIDGSVSYSLQRQANTMRKMGPKYTPTGVSITNREREVLALIREGMTNDEIAARLFVSQATVKTHIANLLHKFEVSNRVQLARLAE